MGQVKLLKIAADGVPLEFDSVADDITLNSFTVQGGGPVLSPTGLDLNNQDVSDINDAVFNDPTTGTINQTAGNLIIDNIMGKERENLMTVAGSVSFPVISDLAGQVDAFRLPALAGSPTASPTNGGEGHLVWDSTNNKMFVWNGVSWDDLSTVTSAENVDDSYIAQVAVAIRDVVYISSADNVSPADNTTSLKAQAVGLAVAGAAPTATVTVRKTGRLAGFTGLTATARYYLDSTAGQIVSTIPSGSGNTIVQVGYAKNTTTLDIQILQLGRRA
ncbi:MAG: hypothetical protein H7836_04480 [Magnetococcus sp. YQC-3]